MENRHGSEFPAPSEPVVEWLLDSDPALPWQVMHDLLGAPDQEIVRERSRVATEGWGARLLHLQQPHGQWSGAAWNHGWNSTMHVLWLWHLMGLDPASPEARQALERVRESVTWGGSGPAECANNPFFAGEIEPCINGQVAAAGAYFRQDVRGLIDRLVGEQLADGGWNCDAPDGSIRASFNTTICVLEALSQYEKAMGPEARVADTRQRGQEYLLERKLLRRQATGEAIERDRKSGAKWTEFAFPAWWHYDVLRGLDYLRGAGARPDERLAEAVELVASKQDHSGRWSLDVEYPGARPVEMNERPGRSSRWNTLRALRVLKWYSEGL